MNMSKKEEKIDTKQKKTFQRWYWLDKKRRRKRKSHKRIINSGIAVHSTPPLRWSTTSLTCPFNSCHTSKKTCIESTWNWSTVSPSTTTLIDQNKQILFHPKISSSTQVILGNQPLPLYGKHYWEIYMPAVYGTSVMFGIATKKQPLSSGDFLNLIGIDEHGWALSHHGLLWHNGISRTYLSKPLELLQPVLIGLEFDADARTLSYLINNQPTGIAFHSIPTNMPIYPAVSSTSAQSTMILQHCCQICSSLRELCIKMIRSMNS